MQKQTIANKLRAAREGAGLTTEQLGEKAGISGAAITMIETGKRTGRLSTLKAIAKALNFDFGKLVG
jgi:transcriptional regulator with XRE-family HTH domain